MSNKIVECIPNFSEGRRLEIVDAIVAAIQAVTGVTLLDRSSDADHNLLRALQKRQRGSLPKEKAANSTHKI